MIPIARPVLGDEEVRAAERALRSGWVVQGPEVAAFESELAAAVGAAHAVAVSSGTAALHLALLAAGVRPGTEVVTVSHSFIATANAVRHAQAIPVFVDIDPLTFNIDPSRVEAALSPRTSAVLAVHQLGLPCDLPALVELCAGHGLPLVEDAACAIGSEILWRGRLERVGRPHGRLACFSFHPRKILTTGDGGMITTADAELARRLRVLRAHGLGAPHPGDDAEGYEELGWNYRMTDIQAAVGRAQLTRLPALLQRRRAQAVRYRELLSDVPGLGLPVEPPGTRGNFQSYCVRLPEGAVQRDVLAGLAARGVSARRGVMCAHREAASAGAFRVAGDLRESERAHDGCVMLPLFHEMTDGEQVAVARALAEVLAGRGVRDGKDAP